MAQGHGDRAKQLFQEIITAQPYNDIVPKQLVSSRRNSREDSLHMAKFSIDAAEVHQHRLLRCLKDWQIQVS